MSLVTAYFKFEVLTQEVRTLNGIKSPNRLDCTATYNPSSHGLLPLFQNRHGVLYLYQIPVRDLVKADSKRRASIALGNGDMNLTSLHFESYDHGSLYCYGYPNGKENLNNGRPNPAARYKHDALLFICDWPRQTVEVLVCQNGKPLIDNIYNLLIDGEFDEEVVKLRGLAGPYFIYKWP